MTTNQQVVPSEWEPLRIAAFRAIWFASLAVNVGTWFQNVGGVWLMTRFAASPLLIALIRTFFFIFFISVRWALLPVIVRQELRLGAPGYGLLLGCIGVGAVVGAAVLPLIQRKIPVVDQQVIISTVALSLVMIALGFLRNLLLLCLIATIGGTAWIMLVSSFNVAAQEASPAWVRARALGTYLVVYKKVPSWYRSSTASTQIRPRTSSALSTRPAECANETEPSAGSSRATRPMKIAMSRHLWPSPGWTICASSTA